MWSHLLHLLDESFADPHLRSYSFYSQTIVVWPNLYKQIGDRWQLCHHVA